MQATYLSTWPCDEIFLPAGASKCGWSSCREGKGMFWPHSWYLTWWVPRLYHGPVWVQPRVCGVQASQWGQGDHIYQHVLSPPYSNLIFQPGGRPLRQHQGMWLPADHCLSKLVRINVLLILHWINQNCVGAPSCLIRDVLPLSNNFFQRPPLAIHAQKVFDLW